MKLLRFAILFLIAVGGLASGMFAQLKLYESTFNGGVVTGGYSVGATFPSGSGSFNVSIPAGSTIRRAYLLAGRCGAAPNVTVTLNGTPFTFSNANIATTGFNTIYGGNSAVHAIDVTASISPATTAYTIVTPAQNTVSDKFPEFYLYIAYDNAGMPGVSSAIYLNTNNMDVSTMNWNLSTTTAVNNGSPVGLAVFGGYATSGGDCEQVTANGTLLGSYGGQDFNATSIWGCMAGFRYSNNLLTGYNDDNANQAMSGTDALSNIQAVLPGTTNSIPVVYNHCGGGGDNHVWATLLTWSGVILDGKLIDFQAEPLQNEVQLRWETSEEQTMSGFELQRSLDGQVFETIGAVAPLGDGEGHAYLWPDAHPRLGSNWYRLRVLDSDGIASFSEVREVKFEGKHALASGLSPNPLPHGNLLQLQLLHAEAVDWTVYSLGDSRELLHGRLNGLAQAALPTEALAPGAYGLKLVAGARVQVLKFVVE